MRVTLRIMRVLIRDYVPGYFDLRNLRFGFRVQILVGVPFALIIRYELRTAMLQPFRV